MGYYKKELVYLGSPGVAAYYVYTVLHYRRENLMQTLSRRELPRTVHRGTWLWLQGVDFPQGDPSVHVPGRLLLSFVSHLLSDIPLQHK